MDKFRNLVKLGECRRTHHMKKIIWLVILGIWTSGCMTLEKGGFVTPAPVLSEYFRTTGAGFSFTVGDPDSIKYLISLDIIKPHEKNIFIDTQFEDPTSAKFPIVEIRTRYLELNQRQELMKEIVQWEGSKGSITITPFIMFTTAVIMV